MLAVQSEHAIHVSSPQLYVTGREHRPVLGRAESGRKFHSRLFPDCWNIHWNVRTRLRSHFCCRCECPFLHFLLLVVYNRGLHCYSYDIRSTASFITTFQNSPRCFSASGAVSNRNNLSPYFRSGEPAADIFAVGVQFPLLPLYIKPLLYKFGSARSWASRDCAYQHCLDLCELDCSRLHFHGTPRRNRSHRRAFINSFVAPAS